MKTVTQAPAFKEWASIVQALGTGEQILILRKGGIHEKGKKFNVLHDSFLLFPTYEHQNSEDLNERGKVLLQSVNQAYSQENPADLKLQYFAKVEDSIWVNDIEKLKTISDYHVWSQNAIIKRFNWSEAKGLYVILVRVFELPAAQIIQNLPKYGGCRSWVDLEISTAVTDLKAVLPESQFLQKVQQIKKLLA